MAKEKKSILSRILISLFTSLLGLVVVAVGAYFYIKAKTGLDLIFVYKTLKVISQPVDESALITNGFDDDDVQSLFDTTIYNATGKNLLIESDDGFKIDIEELATSTLNTNQLILSEKQMSAFASTFIKTGSASASVGEVNIVDYIDIKQIKIGNIIRDGGALKSFEFTNIMLIDTNFASEQLSQFPFNLVSGLVPQKIYLTSVIKVTKTDDSIGYTKSAVSMTINNLDVESAKTFLNMVCGAFGFGEDENISDADEMIVKIGGIPVDVIMGNDQFTGLTRLISVSGTENKTFDVEIIGDVGYYKIIKNPI